MYVQLIQPKSFIFMCIQLLELEYIQYVHICHNSLQSSGWSKKVTREYARGSLAFQLAWFCTHEAEGSEPVSHNLCLVGSALTINLLGIGW